MQELIDLFRQYFYFKVLDLYGAPILAGLLILLFFAETRKWLRKRKADKWQRIRRNIGIAISAFFALRLVLIPVLVLLAKWVQEENFGILNWLFPAGWISWLAGFLLLDYGNYLWHVLNHKWKFLWRFHNVHHIDLDLDVSTAIRFHFGEILFSVFFRGLMIILIGPPFLLVLIYEIIFEGATFFHHSNWRLPFRLEQLLSRFVVTPRMHGIHHSIVQRETNSNYSIIFNFWDRLHRSIRLDIHQDEINIGVPSYRDPDEQNVKQLLFMPLAKPRPWELPDGSIPERKTSDERDLLKK